MRLGAALLSPGPVGEPSWPLSFKPQVYTSPCPVTPAAWLLPMLSAAQRRATLSDCGSATPAVSPTPSCPLLLLPAAQQAGVVPLDSIAMAGQMVHGWHC